MKAPSGKSSLDWLESPAQKQEFLTVLRQAAVAKARRRQRALAGTAALLAVGGLLWLASPSASVAPEAVPAREIATIVRPVTRTLPDGTVVELKDDARIAVDFSGELRRVQLLEGEGHFHVAKNPARPFVVEARGVSVRAVGTAFSVGLSSAQVEVLVTEGSVAVESGAPTLEPALLSAGNRAVVPLAPAPAPVVSQVPAEEMSDRLSWRVPRLDLDGTPLRAAIEALNEHSATRLELADASLGKLELFGVLRADNVEPLLRLLENHYRIRIERRGGVVTLHPPQ